MSLRQANASHANRQTSRTVSWFSEATVVILPLWFGRQGHGGGTSGSLLKQTRAVIDANRVISLYLKGVADSRSIKVKSAPLVTGVIYYCQKQTNKAARRGGVGGGLY